MLRWMLFCKGWPIKGPRDPWRTEVVTAMDNAEDPEVLNLIMVEMRFFCGHVLKMRNVKVRAYDHFTEQYVRVGLEINSRGWTG